MTLTAFILATALLLLTPGPTNTLLAVAGAERGFARGIRLVAYELVAYLAVAMPLALASTALTEAAPHFREFVSFAASAWVAFLAVKLWPQTSAAGMEPARVTGRTVFFTTLLNPKAVIIGLVLLPSGGTLWERSAAFALLILAVAAVWCGAGQLLTARASNGPRLARRVAAVALGILSVVLFTSGLRLA